MDDQNSLRPATVEELAAVHNEGTSSDTWQVRVTLPAGATVTATRAAEKTSEPGNVWIFTAPGNARLKPSLTYLFAFEGKRPSSGFRLGSCTVNGQTCTPFR